MNAYFGDDGYDVEVNAKPYIRVGLFYRISG